MVNASTFSCSSLSNRALLPFNMMDLLAKQDWIRIILMLAFSGYLVHQIYNKTEKLLMREMGFAEMGADSKEMEFPSVTFCPAFITQTSFESFEVGNITADYQNIFSIEDMLSVIRQKININE